MQFFLYRPTLWWDGAVLCPLTEQTVLRAYDRAMLARLRWASPFTSFSLGEIMSHDTSAILRLVTPPEDEPLTLSQAKAFLRIEHMADDTAIATAITAARQYAESYLRTALLPQTWEYTVGNPCSVVLRLPFGPAQEISEITLTNKAGESSEMDEANYRLSVDGFAVHFESAPQVEKVLVAYTAASYENVEAIPAPILQGMLHHVAVMVEARDGAAALPVQSVSCYAPFRRVAL